MPDVTSTQEGKADQEMALVGKGALAAMPGLQSSVPGTHVEGGENSRLRVVLSLPQKELGGWLREGSAAQACGPELSPFNSHLKSWVWWPQPVTPVLGH